MNKSLSKNDVLTNWNKHTLLLYLRKDEKTLFNIVSAFLTPHPIYRLISLLGWLRKLFERNKYILLFPISWIVEPLFERDHKILKRSTLSLLKMGSTIQLIGNSRITSQPPQFIFVKQIIKIQKVVNIFIYITRYQLCASIKRYTTFSMVVVGMKPMTPKRVSAYAQLPPKT